MNDLIIQPFQNAADGRFCAEFMAASESWLKLRLTAEATLQRLTDPTREVHVTTMDDKIVGAFNHRAHNFYERLGHERVEESPNFIVIGNSEILLRKTRDHSLPSRRKNEMQFGCFRGSTQRHQAPTSSIQRSSQLQISKPAHDRRTLV